MIELILELMKILAAPLTDALSSNGAESPEQLEAERQALILAQRRIQEEIARRELPP
jgi:hypothetical protein